MTTGNGLQKPGGSVSVYGGSHGESSRVSSMAAVPAA